MSQTVELKVPDIGDFKDVEVIEVLEGVQGVAFSFFQARDVVRHPLVQRIVQAYEHKTAPDQNS